MPHITSSEPKGKYIAELRSQMDHFFDFGQERFTGFFLGGFFSVTHHCEYHWNRRITSQINSAIGYVKRRDAGCSVYYFHFKGYLHPIRFLILLAVILSIVFSQNAPPHVYPKTILAVFFTVLIFTLFEAKTEESIEGKETLLALLHHPENPYEDFHPNDYLE